MQKSGPRGHCAGGELPGRPGDLGREQRLGLPVQRGRVGPGDPVTLVSVTLLSMSGSSPRLGPGHLLP